ncbi:MAG: conjugal transfer protein TraH [Holosporaceae bacterium]|jgi:conjugative transfer pilus assembly protein TraH|nr:conjugal transfer protein TraH [Holosporaceae bacterium]
MSKRLLFISLLLFQGSYCGIGSDLESFFHKMGTTTNATSPGVHHDQSAGYYSGGGLSLRNRVRNFQPATLQLPNFKAGCGGIDMFTGGFSFVSSAELVNALKSIGSGAVSYGFMLAMKTFAPAVQSVMAELQDMASKINQANINSCETAATLLGGVWPKSDLTGRHICTSMGSGGGMFKDWAAARQGCGSGSERPSVMAKKGLTEEYKNILAEEFNVAWEVIKRNSFLISDQELAHLCMTISGTIVAHKEGESRKVSAYPSKADNDDLIKALFEGGTVSGYGCDETGKCLRVQVKNYNIASGGFGNRVRKILGDITRKAINDEELDQKEIAFIDKVRLPVYKMVNVLATYRRKEYDLKDFTDIICVDLIHQYITEILDVMLEETANLRNAQVSDEEVNKFIAQLQKAKASIYIKRKIAYEQMNQMLIMIETTKTYERKLENTFEALQKGKEER